MSSSPHSRYFQGLTVTGLVTQSETATTFREVVDKLNVCCTLPITRKAYFALPEDERQKAKHVPFFTPACFKSSPSKRVYEQATHCNLVVLDIDPEKEHRDGKWVETGRYPAAPFVNNPELLHQALAGFNFAAHTTASSTLEKPRMRVYVDSNEIPIADYPQAVAFVAKLLGLPSITKESKVAVQPMFLSTLFKDDTEEYHPLLAHEVNCRTLEREDYAHHPSDAKHQGLNGKNGSNAHHPSSDGLEFLRAPLPEITLAITKEALSFISPDCSYQEWLEIAASLKHQFAHSDEDGAYQLFDEWSSTGSKYASEEETKAKWDSLRPTPVGREPRTIRSLLRVAVQSGWDDERVKDKGYNALLAWMETVETPTKLLEQGVRKILAAPQLSSTQEGALLDQLRVRAKERFQHRASLTDLRRDLATLRDKLEKAAQPQEKKKVEPWANGLCFVSVPKEFYRPSNGEKYKPDSFNLRFSRHRLPTTKDLIAAGIPVTEANLSKPITQPTDYVLNTIQVPCFYDYAYAPSQPNEMLFVHEKRKYVNTYSPTYPEVEPEHASAAGQMFQAHLKNLIAEEEYRRILTDFMSYMVQFPGQKIRWAVVIQGAEGAGKTYLAEVMKAVLGRRHVKMVDGTLITSGWSEWTFGYQLAVIEEVRVAGTNRYDIMNRLKPWITNDDIPINEKFRSSRDAQNITNYLLFSNHHDCLTITSNDRRYFILKSPLQEKSQVLALGPNYFKDLFGMLNQHPGAMRAWLLDWKISDDFSPHGQAPRTKYVQDLINDSAGSLTFAIRKVITEEDHPLIQWDIVSAKALLDVLLVEEGLRCSAQQVAQVLREEGYHQIGRHAIGEERHYLWIRACVEAKGVPAMAAERQKKDAKNLCTSVFYS